jgi:hypothetical protein
MGRTRDVSKILTSNTSILSLASASTTYAPIAAGGLVLLNTTDVSGSSQANFDNCFNSTYDRYRVIISRLFASSAFTTLDMRLRSAGSNEASGSNFYKFQGNFVYSTGTTSGYGSNGTTSISPLIYSVPTDATDGGQAMIVLEFENPFQARSTVGTFETYSYQVDTASRLSRRGGWIHTNSASYDGFSLIPSSNTITGRVKVYGYRN